MPEKSFIGRTPTPPVAAVIGVHDTVCQDRFVGAKSLSSDDEAELVQAAEGGQARAGEAHPRGSVAHVEVFRMRRVGTVIFGRPRRLLPDRRAVPNYTLLWEEPVIEHDEGRGI